MNGRAVPGLLTSVLVVLGVSILPPAVRAADGTVTTTIEAGAYTIETTPRGDEVAVVGFGRLLEPGKPDLPARIFSVAVPPGVQVDRVWFEVSGSRLIGLGTKVPPVGLPRVVGQENPILYQRDRKAWKDAYESAYKNDRPYPATTGEFLRLSHYRKYDLVDVRFQPVTYQPLSGKLVYHKNLTVHVDYTVPTERQVLYDALPRTEATAREIIVNYAGARSWYPGFRSQGGAGLYDFVIITLDSLTGAVQPLVDWETTKGRTVQVVTTSWIASTYSGYDLAEKIRNFLREKYPSGQWGIEDVLVVGHRDDIPMRRCAQDIGYGRPETDYYYAELSLADSDSWDDDGDHQWGEDSDPIDFYAEVNVGRIPWSDAATVQHICEKSAAFEQAADPAYKRNILLLGSFFWPDTDNAVLMEYKTDPQRHPWMADWQMTRMYEDGYSSYPMDYDLNWTNVKNVWSTGGYAFVNWAGHGSPWSSHIYYHGSPAFVDTSTCPNLDDTHPSIIFADACSNSDTDNTNIGMEMLRSGGVGFWGATKVAFGMSAWNDPSDGSSQSLDYYFTTCVTSVDYSQGAAQQWCLRKMYTDGLFYYVKYEMFEWGAYWGNPDLSLDLRPALDMTLPDGPPGPHLPPGPPVAITLEIKAGLENYLSGSGRLHYRFDPQDSYSEAALNPLGGDLYEALLPGPVPGDQPEFYFSARGDGGTTVSLPFDAPNSVFACDVCIMLPVFQDAFEEDQGWEVRYGNTVTGVWERGDPEGTDFQPEDDHSPDGTACFVTGLAGGGSDDNDVDGGFTRLLSPSFDLSDGDAEVSFYLWYANDGRGTIDPLQVQVSNNYGITWTDVTDVDHAMAWDRVAFNVKDYVWLSPGVCLRFTIADDPDDSIVEAGVDDVLVARYDHDPSLWAGAYSVSVSSGGSIDLHLAAGATQAGRDYLLLGTTSGTEPGFDLPGPGAHMPINWDVFTNVVLLFVNTQAFQNFMGSLDATGSAVATLDTMGPVDPIMTGLTTHFSYLLLPAPDFDFTSIPVGISFEP